ncbi:MAG: hypothetical protein JNJ61_03690 [Anaerolineae bacterium]|nr:hypothetical protein [Anaerolineae bacterium]
MFNRSTLKLLSLLWVLLAASCQAMQATTETPTITLTPTPIASEKRIEYELDGMSLSVEVPAGWEWKTTDKGLVMAEHFAPMEVGSALMGVQAYVFFHSLDGFDLPTNTDANAAYAVLEQIVASPSYIGEAAVSAVEGFTWADHDAAYYLANNGNGNLSMLLALVVTQPPRLVVCNISSPEGKAASIRDVLPRLLGTLQIDDQPLQAAALEDLPTSFTFPEYKPGAKAVRP